jgi:hypothetical protein
MRGACDVERACSALHISADEVLLTHHCLAAPFLFDSRVRVAQARQQHEHVLAITCKTFGADHPHTITPLHNAGLMTWAMGAANTTNAFSAPFVY